MSRIQNLLHFPAHRVCMPDAIKTRPSKAGENIRFDTAGRTRANRLFHDDFPLGLTGLYFQAWRA